MGLLLASALAFWPVWQWQFLRMQDGSDEPYGILALVTAIAFLATRKSSRPPSTFQYCAATGCIVVYAACFHFLPPLVRALLAALTLSVLGSARLGTRGINLALLGLAVLSLPLVASLQFYLGFPVRYVTAHLSADIISFLGYPSEAVGTVISWQGEKVVVDAPCAGIRMLWSGLFVAFSGALFKRFSSFAVWASYSASVVLIFIGNLFRNVALFFTESGIILAPEWAHDTIGMVALALVVASIIYSQSLISRVSRAHAY